MISGTPRDFQQQVGDTLTDLGYRVFTGPKWGSKWGFLPWRRPKYNPDFLIRSAENEAIVETRDYPILLGSVIQVIQCADHFDTKAVVCVPDAVYPMIPTSVMEYARQQDLQICDLGQLGGVLAAMLGEAASQT